MTTRADTETRYTSARCAETKRIMERLIKYESTRTKTNRSDIQRHASRHNVMAGSDRISSGSHEGLYRL